MMNHPNRGWKTLSPAQAEKIIADAEEDGVRVVFLIPPACGGQIVEYSYAGIGEVGILERCNNRSEGSKSYRLRSWRKNDESRPGLNDQP